MYRGGATYADAVTFGAEKVEKSLLDEFAKMKGKKVLTYSPVHLEDLSDYMQLYNDLSV